MALDMRIPTLGETELLVPLQEGLFEQPLWQTFLTRVRAAGGASGACLLLDGGGEEIRLGSGALFGDAALARLREIAPQLRAERVYSRDDLADADAFPEGMRLVRIGSDDGIAATLVLFSDTPLEARASALLGALVPHLKAALRTFAVLERERSRRAVSEGVAARMNFGWITLDRQGRIVDCNAAADRMLAVSDLLGRGAYDRLVPSSPSLDRELTKAIGDCAADQNLRPRALTLSHDPWIDLLVSPVRLEGLGAGGRAMAVVYLRGDRTSEADRREQLGDLFQLTPAEARVAWSMAQGLSIAESAKEHGLTLETARYYSKKIYAKTGARGQSDLVRNILTSVLALA